MSKALIAGINQVATDKGLDREVIFQAIEAALVSAYRRNYGTMSNVSAEVDRVSGDMRVYAEREVVEEVYNLRTEVTEQDARKSHPDAKLGDVVRVPSAPDDFGRIAAQTAKQVILQRIREAERDTVYENFAHQVGEIVNTQIRSIDAQSGAVTVLLGEKHEILLMREDLIAAEKLRRGDFIRVYVVDVHKSTRGPVIKLSRTHRNLLRRLMEQEIPEVRDGVVEIKAIAREPGARSKVAVVGTVPGIDPVGSCVGMRGLRIQNIVNELAGEKIDVIEWSTDIGTYITNALSPAKVSNVILDEHSSIKTAVVVVPDRQLSLAIGKEGQNARLAAKLTGWRIDIKSESEAQSEGLDKLMGERSRKSTNAAEDLLTMAERILRNEDETPASSAGDRLWQAMQSLQDIPAVTSESLDAMDAKLSAKESKAKSRSVEKAEPEIELPVEVLPEELVVPEWPTEALLAEVGEPAFSVEEIEPPVVEEKPPTPIVAPSPAPANEEINTTTGLPQVITADMLRARMAQRKQNERKTEEMEIPAELLVGITDDKEELVEVWEEEIETGKGKGKGKKPAQVIAKPVAKPKKKKRRPVGDEDDDYSGYF
ncbi:MAG: transcription termination factor NusA [Chloroflexi bacterium]|nr:transcription termination factor NusA [Chloroflexota bacterium]